MRCCFLLAYLVLLQLPAAARAETRFVIQAHGSGFADRSVVLPQGGNTATTLGEQRRAAVQRAADTWGARLESAVPVTLDVDFEDLHCGDNATVLAGAAPVHLFSGMEVPGADPTLSYPSALANRLAARDLDPSKADIEVSINASVDSECRAALGGFYYGFDGKHGEAVDLIEVMLHELAHGLGFASIIDLRSGAAREAAVDVFSAHILDLDSKKTWNELTDDERRASALKVRRLAFQGVNTAKAAAELLGKGSPTLSLNPTPPGFVGAVGETGMSYPDLEGPVRLAGSFQGCVNSTAGLSGGLVLIRPDCMGSGQLVPRLKMAGAAGALIVLPSDYAEPALSHVLWEDASGVPSLVVSEPDAALMRTALAAGPLSARVHWDTSRLAGADAEGRPLLFASRPADSGSSVSHFEPLARPDLLMEPFSGPTPHHAFDLTWPVLKDLGWASVLCGNRRLDAGEECDEGDANSDTLPNACRTSCLRAHCGDGVLDGSESCDKANANSDSLADACRMTCTLARCGDGVLDKGEACDQGLNNDDTRANACRKECRVARCGDGVVDKDETCDQGASNADNVANACRTDCRAPRCGDGVVDKDEACDKGASNDDVLPNACRKDCRAPRCGDGVVDDGELCDGTESCTSSCQKSDSSSAEPWLDPWDAPSDKRSHKKQSGCALSTGAPLGSSAPGLRGLALLGFGFVLLARFDRRRARSRGAKREES